MAKCALALKVAALILLFSIAFSASTVGRSYFTVAHAAGTTLQLCLIFDGSSSVTAAEWTVITQAMGNAIIHNVPRDGTVELTVIQYGYTSSNGYAKVEVLPTVITVSNYVHVSNDVDNMIQGDSGTSTVHGFYLAWETLKTSPNFSPFMRQVINLATDGYPSVRNKNATSDLDSSNVTDARDDMIAAVIKAASEGLDEFDVEGIGMNNSTRDWYKNWAVWPQPGILAPPFGKRGWIRSVADVAEFESTIDQKFQIVIPEFPSLALLPALVLATLPLIFIKGRKGFRAKKT
jgi:hypothetical protein